ncbi:MAG: DUF2007 domain-containing protein [Gammaproteobacteria bacterium]|nr:MAG: DUF2007 domain-containing protein [Gammaproteobacteria bacterium]
MKLIYTHENRLLVNNIQNILENAGVSVTLKNEYAGGASGDLSFLSTWLEVWVLNDEDYDKAIDLIKTSFNSTSISDWICDNCSEANTPSFELCWNCQYENAV